jgi:hypothetical protein
MAGGDDLALPRASPRSKTPPSNGYRRFEIKASSLPRRSPPIIRDARRFLAAKNSRYAGIPLDGANRDRTGDLLLAKAPLARLIQLRKGRVCRS